MGDSVKLNIISGFDPTGMNKAKNAMRGLAAETVLANKAMKVGGIAGISGQANLAAKSVAKLASAFGLGGGVAGQAEAASSAMKGLLKAGPIGIVIAAALALGTAIFFIQKKWFAVEKAADEASKKMRKAFESGLERAKMNQITQLKEEYAALSKEIDLAVSRFEKLTAANERLNKSGSGKDKSQAENMAANVEAGYSTAMYNAVTQEEKALILAERNLEIVRLKNSENVRSAQSEVTASERSLRNELEKNAFAKERLAAAKEQLALAEKSASQMPTTGYDKEKKAAYDLVVAAKEDVAKARTDIEAGAIAVKASEFELESANLKLATARTNAAMKENAAKDAQDAVLKAVNKRAVVLTALNTQEERLANAVMNEAIARERGLSKENARNAAVAGGAAGLHAGREAVREGKKGMEEANAKEARWAANQEKKLESGTKLSPKNLQRLLDFRDFKQLQGRGGQKEFDVAANEKQKIMLLTNHLIELQTLNRNINNSLTGN